MADLKRNTITIVLEVQDGAIIRKKTYLTPVFIPLSTIYEALDLMEEIKKRKALKTERELIDALVTFITDKVYDNQFTKEDLIAGLHSPNAMAELFNQLLFIARGEQSEETKKYLETMI